MSLAIKNLSFSYRNTARQILNNISLTANEGQLISIIGPNGSGKTTLIKCINLIHTYNQGLIQLSNQDIKGIKRSELAKKIGYVPQISKDVMTGTVIDIVLMGRHPHTSWKPTKKDVDIAFSILEEIGITELSNCNYHSLSGGQKQKVLIARALAQEPQVFLFDEPTSFLDIGNQLEIMEKAKQLALLNKIVIVVVHDLNMAKHYSDHVVLLNKGHIVSAGTSSQVLTTNNIKSVYGVDVSIDFDGYIRLWH